VRVSVRAPAVLQDLTVGPSGLGEACRG
jgi:hypothetical protein